LERAKTALAGRTFTESFNDSALSGGKDTICNKLTDAFVA